MANLPAKTKKTKAAKVVAPPPPPPPVVEPVESSDSSEAEESEAETVSSSDASSASGSESETETESEEESGDESSGSEAESSNVSEDELVATAQADGGSSSEAEESDAEVEEAEAALESEEESGSEDEEVAETAVPVATLEQSSDDDNVDSESDGDVGVESEAESPANPDAVAIVPAADVDEHSDSDSDEDSDGEPAIAEKDSDTDSDSDPEADSDEDSDDDDDSSDDADTEDSDSDSDTDTDTDDSDIDVVEDKSVAVSSVPTAVAVELEVAPLEPTPATTSTPPAAPAVETEAEIIAAHEYYATLAAESSAAAWATPAVEPAVAKAAKQYEAQKEKMHLGSRLSSVELSTLAASQGTEEAKLKTIAEALSPTLPSSAMHTVPDTVEAAEVDTSVDARSSTEDEEVVTHDTGDTPWTNYTPEAAVEETVVYTLPYLDAQTWISILFLLKSDKDVLTFGSVCKGLNKLILDPSVVSSWLLRRSSHYLVIYNTYKNFPRLLTPPVSHALISLGAHIPRHLSSLIALENPEILDRSSSREPTPFSESLELLVWTGKTTYGDMFGFDAETAVNATLVPGQEAPEVINAKILQYKRVLGWAYEGVVDRRLEGTEELDDKKEEKQRRREVMKDVTDADAFLHLLELYRATFEGKETFIVDSSKPVGRGRFVGTEQKKNMLKDSTLSEQEKQRNKIAAALRELSNIYRFAPGLIAEKLEVGWLPVDLFERDVELAWFLLRHAGDARQRVVADAAGLDDVTYRTLLGYRVHINTGTGSLPAGAADVVPFGAIAKLITQGNISLTDAVLLRMLGKYTNQMTVDRLARFVPRAQLQQIGEVLLTECFEKPMLDDAIASGYISRPIQRAEILVKIFSLDKSSIARSFMGTPKDWENYIPPPAPQTTCTHIRQPNPNKQDGLYQYDVGMLTRQAQASGSLPWVSWQWIVQHLGPDHPVSRACLHDVSVRSFNDHAPLNPGDHDAISFPRKEADASVKALLALGVTASMATVSTAVRKALYEIEVAALSGEAAAAMKSQAAQLKGKKGQIASAVAAAAATAGANAISRRHVYILMDIEKNLLSHGSDEPTPATIAAASTKKSKSSDKGDTSSLASSSTIVTGGVVDASALVPQVEIDVEVLNGGEIVKARKTVALYPQALLPQPRTIWLSAIKDLITENDTWKDLSNSAVSPNACRRFCLAATNIVRGLEQFGMPASALAVLKSKKGNSKSVKSMSSSESDNTMLYGLWVREIEAADQEKDRIRRGVA
ncbi:UNVERIFIED_CONTAM: hypothetical protein HDU68_003753 [Siphonaria sp. JEL0065]|nr:hypothetical protein HDU68_003753 [Siphonaria sp. JEL0065]